MDEEQLAQLPPDLIAQLLAQQSGMGGYLDPMMLQLMMNMFVTPELPMDIDDQRDYRNAYQDTLTTGADRMSAYMTGSFAPGAFEDIQQPAEYIQTPGIDSLTRRASGNPDSFYTQVAQWAMPTELGGPGLDEGEIMMRIQSVIDGEADISPEAQATFIKTMPAVQEAPNVRRRNQNVGGNAATPLVDMEAVRSEVNGILTPVFEDLSTVYQPGVQFDEDSQAWFTQAPAEQSEASEWLDRVNLPNPYLEYGTAEYHQYSDPEEFAAYSQNAAGNQAQRQELLGNQQRISEGIGERRDYDDQMANAMAEYQMAMNEWGRSGNYDRTPHNYADRQQGEQGQSNLRFISPGSEEWMELKTNPLAKYNRPDGSMVREGPAGGQIEFTVADVQPGNTGRGAKPNQTDYTEPVHNNFGPTSTVSMFDMAKRQQDSLNNRKALQAHTASQAGTANDLLKRVMQEQVLASQGRTPGRDTVMARLAPLYSIGALGR